MKAQSLIRYDGLNNLWLWRCEDWLTNPRSVVREFKLERHSPKHQSIYVSFPPHAKAQALAAFDRVSLFLNEIQHNPPRAVLMPLMIGPQVTNREPSAAGRVQRANVPREKQNKP